MKQREFTFQVVNGKLPEGTQKAISELLKGLEGKKAVLTVKEAQRPRSGRENRYYWGVVIPAVTDFFREAGNTVDGDDVHTYLKLHVGKLAQIFVTPDGQMKKSLRSTAKLTVPEFEAYLERIRSWAADYGCVIPLPNEF